ncbi:MAG: EamA family transporter RarD [Treponema sp.]|jgi:chloramphenicol-sensitive protein RarD|nr:EamA family transporter RarD [Treponema sp.]
MSDFKRGVPYAVFAYTLWGFLPVYWRLLGFVSPLHILGCRIIFSLLFTSAILFAKKNTAWLQLLFTPGRRRFTAAAALAVTLNWGIYIWAVNSGHTIEASLGYYINPLVAILLGLVFLRERLNVLQWAAFALAALGVILNTIFSGVFPLISLLLAVTFGVYSLFKKQNSAGALETLSAETLSVFPAGLLLLAFPLRDLGVLGALSFPQWLLLAGAGPATAIPLFAFSKSAKLIPLSALGFLQFINPTILFFLGIFVFDEPFNPRGFWSFACIWAAVALYCVSLRKGLVRSRNHS